MVVEDRNYEATDPRLNRQDQFLDVVDEMIAPPPQARRTLAGAGPAGKIAYEIGCN